MREPYSAAYLLTIFSSLMATQVATLSSDKFLSASYTVDATGDLSGHPWFVLRVETGREFAASTHLQSRQVEHFLPTYTLRRKYAHHRAEALPRALFAGYLFARFPLKDKTLVLQSPHVYDLLTFAHSPAMIENQEIDRVRALASTPAPTPWSRLLPGMTVIIRIGPMAGMEGVLAKIEDTYHFAVNVQMLGRAVSVRVDPSMVEAA